MRTPCAVQTQCDRRCAADLNGQLASSVRGPLVRPDVGWSVIPRRSPFNCPIHRLKKLLGRSASLSRFKFCISRRVLSRCKNIKTAAAIRALTCSINSASSSSLNSRGLIVRDVQFLRLHITDRIFLARLHNHSQHVFAKCSCSIDRKILAESMARAFGPAAPLCPNI